MCMEVVLKIWKIWMGGGQGKEGRCSEKAVVVRCYFHGCMEELQSRTGTVALGGRRDRKQKFLT